MATAFEKFEELETRIVRTVELVKTTRHEKELLERELAGARASMARMERELDELRRDRDIVKDKVEMLLENLSQITEETSV